MSKLIVPPDMNILAAGICAERLRTAAEELRDVVDELRRFGCRDVVVLGAMEDRAKACDAEARALDQYVIASGLVTP